MTRQLCGFILGSLLIISLFLPSSQRLWTALDLSFFQYINSFLDPASITTKVLAFLNSRYGDWIAQGLLLGIFFAGAPSKSPLRVLIVVLFIAAVIVVVNKMIFLKLLNFKRASPTFRVGDFVSLEHIWPLWNNHSFSKRAYPGDHATTLFLASLWLYRDCGRFYGTIGLIVGLFFSFPRLISGAHGLSDLICGSLAITLIVAPFIYFLPKGVPYVWHNTKRGERAPRTKAPSLDFFRRHPK